MKQKGYVQLTLVIFAVLIGFMIFPIKFPKQNLTKEDGSQYCREFVNDANATTINIPTAIGEDTGTFKLIKQNVPVNPDGYQSNHHVAAGGNILAEGKNYQILYPSPDTGRSYDFNTEDGVISDGVLFEEYGLVFLLHLKPDLTREILDSGTTGYEIIDIYQDVTKPPIPKAENILKCVDVGTQSVIDPVVVVPKQTVNPDKKELQLEWFLIKQAKLLPKAWWTPECKPAIYLYPPQKQLVNVKVFPKGFLTFTDPPYPSNGWNVFAQPTGSLFSMNMQPLTNNYLYYESKIYDSEIKKPDNGWVIPYRELEKLYGEILPQLGLNEKETKDFIDYWTKSLPEAPYYFLGIMDKENIDSMEPLEITPKPDYINRVRIYFERVEEFKAVEAPELSINHEPKTHNFKVTEWGGMVKNDKDHPFTCSQ